MPNFRFNSIVALLLGSIVLASWQVVTAQDAEPMLPEWEEAAPTIGADTLAPAAGLLPDPGPEGEPVDLPPASALPDLPPLQAPSDGEPAPELPSVPGLVAPKPSEVPLNEAGQPATPDPLAAIGEAVHWHRSPREARAEAAKEGRPMLLVFGGFGWSPACQALNNDLFTNEAFNKYAAKNLVLSFINVPTRSSFSALGSNTPDRKQQQMDAIKAYRTFLRVRSLPTMILFDSEGHEVDRLVGYNFNRGLRLTSLAKAVERIQVSADNIIQIRKKRDEHRKVLTETQHYRMWHSRIGSELFAKYVGPIRIPAPTDEDDTAMEPAAILMDEAGKRRFVPLRHLTVFDAEIVRRTNPYAQNLPNANLPVRTPDSPDATVNVATPVSNEP